MPAAGNAFLIETPLPGHAGGGRHLSVVLSDQAYNQRTGYPVVAPLRRVAPNAYRLAVTPVDFVAIGAGRPLDAERVMDLGQLCAVESRNLGPVYGQVRKAAIERAMGALPRQFQLAQPPWRRRGEIWSSTRGEFVLASNDMALSNAHQQQFLALPYCEGVKDAPLTMLGAQELLQQRGQLAVEQQHQLDQTLLRIFGLKSEAHNEA